MKEDDFFPEGEARRGLRLEDSKIAIIGLGLMGGSLALALKGRCRGLIGIDSHPATLELARAKKMVDGAGSDPAKLLPEADLVILAVPVPAILEWLGVLPRYIRRPCIVLDLGSTKREITRAMEILPSNFDPVGGHPICGREQLGIRNAAADLYRNAPFVVTPLARSTKFALSVVGRIISTVGAYMLELAADQHDRILASTSHLPFLLSSALALGTPQENAPFIGTGFRSVSRLAGTPASMMLGVMRSNRDNILDSLRRFRESLSLIEAALNARDSLELENILNRSRQSCESLLNVASPRSVDPH
jgi:prephenate dehydrogenase